MRLETSTKGFVEKVLMLSYFGNLAIVRFMIVGAYGSTPGRNALRPYGILAECRKIGMFFFPRIFAFISDQLHSQGFSTSPCAEKQVLMVDEKFTEDVIPISCNGGQRPPYPPIQSFS